MFSVSDYVHYCMQVAEENKKLKLNLKHYSASIQRGIKASLTFS